MSEQPNHLRGLLSGITIILFSVLLSGSFYCGFYLLARKQAQFGVPQQIIVQVVSVVVCIFLTQFLSRKVQGNRLAFLQAFLGGWLSSLILCAFVTLVFKIYSHSIGEDWLPEGAFAQLLMLYSFLGIVISLILGLILKKE